MGVGGTTLSSGEYLRPIIANRELTRLTTEILNGKRSTRLPISLIVVPVSTLGHCYEAQYKVRARKLELNPRNDYVAGN